MQHARNDLEYRGQGGGTLRELLSGAQDRWIS
jgi:hypothetical protein